MFSKGSRIRFADVTDGMSNTFAVGERDSRSSRRGVFGAVGDPYRHAAVGYELCLGPGSITPTTQHGRSVQAFAPTSPIQLGYLTVRVLEHSEVDIQVDRTLHLATTRFISLAKRSTLSPMVVSRKEMMASNWRILAFNRRINVR